MAVPDYSVGDQVEVFIGVTWRKATATAVDPARCARGFDLSTYNVRLEGGKQATVGRNQMRRA